MDVFANETPEVVYTGIGNAAIILNNIDYIDVKNTNTWAKEAIYETGALGIFKGYGMKQFGLNKVLSKEEAISIAYRLAGREADAQKAAEQLYNTRKNNAGNVVRFWSDGYLQLAANEGLISQQDLNDAFSENTEELTPESFHRSAPAQRQEMAFWMAKALALEPVYGQQKIFNSYSDWKNADPIKIPYIETILLNDIMNGDEKGNFKPTQSITREQSAQIAKNTESILFPRSNLERKIGTIESVSNSKDYTNGNKISRKFFNIRNTNGKLHKIIVEYADSNDNSSKNEQNGTALPAVEKDLIVYRDGIVGKSTLLMEGDRIEYITAPDNTVKYVKVISNTTEMKYIGAQINSIDQGSSTINVTQFFNLDYPDIELIKENVSFDMKGQDTDATYRYSSNVSIIIDNKKTGIEKLSPYLNVILAVQNNNVIVEIRVVDFNMALEGKNVIKGIVEENNPKLGYLTLYNEDGTGTGSGSQQDLILFRTFNYVNRNNIEVFKNHEQADIDDVETGDTVFIRLDDDGNVIDVSAVDNYTVKYGRVISKTPVRLIVEYDDGMQQILETDSDMLVFAERKLASYSRLKEGDRIRLLLNVTNKFTKIKEITIEGDEHFITGIFKGVIAYIDDTSNKLVVQNLQTLDRGDWIRTEQKGFTDINLAEQYNIYYGDRTFDIDKVNRYLKNNEAYIAVEKDYGGELRAVLVSYRNSDDAEVVYEDIVATALSGTERFSLSKSDNYVNFSKGSIVVKDGRLVTGNSISNEDMAYVVANRNYDTGEYNAGVVQINDRSGLENIQIYRGRIKDINENKDFTVESFSRLKDGLWEYTNTSKTFKITYDTSILSNDGVVNQRDFKGYGDKSYNGSVVYIAATDTNAVMISTAPYGSSIVKGDIYQITGGSTGEDGKVTGEPTGFSIRNTKVYSLSEHKWVDSKVVNLSILKNSIILKDGRTVKASDLKKGDRVRIVKKEEDDIEDAYIIIVEN